LAALNQTQPTALVRFIGLGNKSGSDGKINDDWSDLSG
jgi:hypothetical protein